MRILYRILDWCQRNKADVFLQQMWGNVRWNAFPSGATIRWPGYIAGRTRWKISAKGWPPGRAPGQNQTLHLHSLAVHHERAQRQLVLVARAADG